MNQPWNDAPPPQSPIPQLVLPTVGPVVKTLMIINAVMFGVLLLAQSYGPAANFIYQGFALQPEVWRDFFPFVPFWQLLTAGFLHSVDGLMHLAGNMLVLFFFGSMLERHLGGQRFLFVYLSAIAVSSAVGLTAEFVTGDLTPGLGASGGISALLVACATLWPRRTVLLFFFPVQLVWLVSFLVAGDLVWAIREAQTGEMTGIGHWVHLGGALYGFLGIRLGWFRADPLQKLAIKRAAAQAAAAVEEDQRVDAILDKIKREGMHSLTRGEKKLLERRSKSGRG